MKTFNFILPIMFFLSLILGCGGTTPSTIKTWQKAKAITESLDHPNALAQDGEFIYFVSGGTVASKNEGTNNLMKMPAARGAPKIIFKGGDIIPDSHAVAVDDNFVYFSANGLRRVPKTGGEAVLLTEASVAVEIIADKENVYWLPYVGEGMPPAPVYAVSKNGGAAKTLTDARKTANGLCVDDRFVYWIQIDGIYQIGKQGGNIEKIYSLPLDGEIVSDLKMDAENFYFLRVKSRELMKLGKFGAEPKLLAKEVSRFWVGENEIIFQRARQSFNAAIFKIRKNGESETEMDSGGYLSDLTIGGAKIYVSDAAKIYELEK